MNFIAPVECEARYVLKGKGVDAQTISSRKAVVASDGVTSAVRDVLQALLERIRPDADRFAGLNARFGGDVQLMIPHCAADTNFYLEPGIMIELSSLNLGLNVSIFLEKDFSREAVVG